MNIVINGEIPCDVNIEVRLDNIIKTIDNLNSSISFNVEEKQKCIFYIEQKTSKNKVNFISMLLFVFTCIIQGVINIIFMNTNWDWYNNIKPYCLKANLLIDVQEDMEILINYEYLKYNKKIGLWLTPLISCNKGIITNVRFNPNFFDFKNQCVSYLKRFISISSIIITIFGLILFSALKLGNYMAVSAMFVLILGVVLLIVFISINELRKCQVLLQDFREKYYENHSDV